MTSLFDFTYLIVFLPIVMVVYQVLPKRFRWAALLLASYVFFWCISNYLITYLLVSTVSIYVIGRRIGTLVATRAEQKKLATKEERPAVERTYTHKIRLTLALGLVINIGMLAACKYLLFAERTANSLLHLLGMATVIDIPPIAAPIGISFYTLIAASYLIDVTRGTIQADNNLGRVALFLSFFPQIFEGPICRYKDTTEQLMAGVSITSTSLFAGSLRILWGFAKKSIIADRLNLYVKNVFAAPDAYDGGMIALAAVLYTIQLYCDFSGAIDVALGSARMFNITMPENFRQPFFSRTAAEFWQRWHITLGTWFKDYVYYPISLSKFSKRITSTLRKRIGNRYGPLVASSIALFAVWLGNGIWHGAGYQYIFFGLYYFVLIVSGSLILPVVQKATDAIGINRESWWYRGIQMLRTLILVFIGELFFRAEGLRAGLTMFGKMVNNFTLDSFTNGTVFATGIDGADFVALAFGIVVILVVGIIKERGTVILERIFTIPTALRWSIWIFLCVSIVIFGAYGGQYAPVDPIYANF